MQSSEKPKSRHMSATEAQFEAQKLAFAPIMFQAVRVLRDSGILEYVHNNKGATTDEIVANCDYSHYSCTVLLEAGLGANVVTADSEKGRWRITKIGYFILQDDLTRVNMDFTQDVCYQAMFHLEESLQEEKPVGLKELGPWETIYEGLTLLPPKALKSWLAFDHYYSDGTFPVAAKLILSWGAKNIMDIGGNVGKFAIVCAKQCDEIRVTIVDLPKMSEKARANIEAAGYSDRISLQPTNMLAPSVTLPSGHDVIWLSQFLCCFSEKEIISILMNAREAMEPNSRLLIMDTFWDQQKYEATTYSLQATSLYFTCLANGNSRMYDIETMRNCIQQSGLKVENERKISLSHTILECKKE